MLLFHKPQQSWGEQEGNFPGEQSSLQGREEFLCICRYEPMQFISADFISLQSLQRTSLSESGLCNLRRVETTEECKPWCCISWEPHQECGPVSLQTEIHPTHSTASFKNCQACLFLLYRDFYFAVYLWVSFQIQRGDVLPDMSV